jgi:DNA-binding NarL/FixJ family response regulator
MCDDPHIHMTVLVVDDHPTFRASVRRLLELEGFRVVAEAQDARAALRLVREVEPELMLLDVGLPDRSGFEVARELAGGSTRVVLISSRAQADLGPRVRASGALGLISKEQLSGEAILALLGRAS